MQCWKEKISQKISHVPEQDNSTQDLPKDSSPAETHRALIVGEQVSACAFRDCLKMEFGYTDVQVGSFFMMDEEIMEEGDRHFSDEDEFVEMTMQNGAYDLVICDPLMYPLIPYKPEKTMPWPHTAVSGRIYMTRGANIFGEKGSAYIKEKIGE